MIARTIGLLFWTMIARLKLCLANIDEEEVQRILRTRMRLMAVLGGVTGALLVVAGSTSAGMSMVSHKHVVTWPFYVPGAVLGLVTMGIWLYARTMIRRAIKDRERLPVPVQGTVCRLVMARAGGNPVLLRSREGRYTWLTGSQAVLRQVRVQLGSATGKRRTRAIRITVTLLYYQPSHVIREIPGLAIEQLDAALAAEPVFA